MSKPSIVSAIAARLPTHTGCRPWFERVDASQAKLLEQIMAGWKAGELGTRRKTAAVAIAAELAAHGIDIGWQGVSEWLRKNPQ